MKKLSTLLIIAFAMVLGLTQCKKKVDTIATPNNLGKTVHITVNVGGDKHEVFPNTGAVVYKDSDVIYVGNGGKYIGYLTYGSGAFSGDIYGPSTADYLHFYFVGGLTPSATPVAGTTANFTVNIADQSSILPVLSYAHSTQKYVDGTTTYDCTLLNKCGLVKFVPATATSETVTVGGMKTTATIDFADPGITPTATTGKVTLYSESNEAKWAILLPQEIVSNPTVTIAGYNSTITSVPAVTENMYYTEGVSIAMSLPVAPEGAAGGPANAGQFSVSGDKHVWFSQGNLQYIGSAATPYWKFADNQYDYLGATPGQESAAENVDRDLFGWGTSGISGYTPIAVCYQPWSTSTNNAQYNPYGSTSTNLYDGGLDAGKADWGYNAISNGGNTPNMWRTLTNAEWGYVFDTRSTTSGHRYARATVCGVWGVILLPDNWSDDTYSSLKNYDTAGAAFTDNTINVAGWATLEAAGCVFLPTAGNRNGTSVNDVGYYGGYWSSSLFMGIGTYGSYVCFYPDYLEAQDISNKYYGYSVRLVCEVEE